VISRNIFFTRSLDVINMGFEVVKVSNAHSSSDKEAFELFSKMSKLSVRILSSRFSNILGSYESNLRAKFRFLH